MFRDGRGRKVGLASPCFPLGGLKVVGFAWSRPCGCGKLVCRLSYGWRPQICWMLKCGSVFCSMPYRLVLRTRRPGASYSRLCRSRSDRLMRSRCVRPCRFTLRKSMLGLSRRKVRLRNEKAGLHAKAGLSMRLWRKAYRALAALTTASLVMPSSFMTTSPGADRPKVSVPIALPAVPT